MTLVLDKGSIDPRPPHGVVVPPGVWLSSAPMEDFDPRSLPRSYFETRISALREQLAAEQSAVARTSAELDWWEHGLALFTDEPAGDGDTKPRPVPTSQLALAHGGEPTGADRPTARQAVLAVLRENPGPMKASELLEKLSSRGWMPGGEYAENTVRNKLRDLVKRGAVQKVAYGTYQLTPPPSDGGQSDGEAGP